ncbi:rCG60642 [Rattus norvegicus]|uniref:RCG60642 n=1 Tax=Rattus norvegicus TaxID=10116 RepID=A6JKU5_RAT|nr:rCG60642 [Rattus norvegicus]
MECQQQCQCLWRVKERSEELEPPPLPRPHTPAIKEIIAEQILTITVPAATVVMDGANKCLQPLPL